MKKHILSFILLSVILASCGEPTIDGSSEEAAKESIEHIQDKLDEEEEKKFNESLMIIAMSELDLSLTAMGEPDAIVEEIFTEIDGKSASEIIEEAERVEKEREERRRQQALDEIAELEEKKALSEEAEEKLNQNFEVTRSRYYKRERDFGGSEPIIEVGVKNHSEHAISRIFFKGIVESPDREVPWIEESFNYSIAGGLEPGETLERSLAPNRFSDWGTTDVPNDALLILEVIGVEDAAGDRIYNTDRFTERDQERLESLSESYMD